jgi:hypothetical protein
LGGVKLPAAALKGLYTPVFVTATTSSSLKAQKGSGRGGERIASETRQPAKALSHVITLFTSRQQSLLFNEVDRRAQSVFNTEAKTRLQH